MRTILVVVALGALAGCGAKFETSATDDGGAHDAGTTDGAHDAGTTDGASDGGWSPVCPAALPAVGSACPTEGVACEYGDSVYTACNKNVACAQGAWRAETYPGPACPSGPNPGVCAASFAAVPRGAACAPIGTECAYPQGACHCEYGGFGPPPPQDGGPSPTWRCDDPQPDCPATRPRIGSACGSPNKTCMYVECAFGETCMGGVWTASPVACAGAQ